MLKQPMIGKLAAMRLLGMTEALKAQEQEPSARELSFLKRFGMLVDQQWNWRENQALPRRLRNAKLRSELAFQAGKSERCAIQGHSDDGAGHTNALPGPEAPRFCLRRL